MSDPEKHQTARTPKTVLTLQTPEIDGCGAENCGKFISGGFSITPDDGLKHPEQRTGERVSVSVYRLGCATCDFVCEPGVNSSNAGTTLPEGYSGQDVSNAAADYLIIRANMHVPGPVEI